MTSILTGDIINSRKIEPQHWMPVLKAELNKYGSQPSQWEIYRGDSFQLEVSPSKAIEVAILIKATMKQFKPLDVRVAIGIGDKTYTSTKIKESNGSAFVYSGECFEQLKKQTIAIKSPWETFDKTINLMLQLALLSMDYWKPAYSTIIKTALEYPEKTQEQIAHILGKTQGTISVGLNRVGYDEIKKLITYYKNYIQTK
ncbi:transcriptional regulator [Aquimarina sediminis]|uniref:transcriptional regulator n=1 Tax=Aquimarina sediminis TaxID=2070536 RepID=UPI000CA088CB|nr:transcriptional regulator [Aquimarina sediminis]